MNLALALAQNPMVEDVDFETVWAQGHTEAERTGDSDSNFIAWIAEVMQDSTPTVYSTTSIEQEGDTTSTSGEAADDPVVNAASRVASMFSLQAPIMIFSLLLLGVNLQ